ncbi:MAG: pseudouridine synthase [Bdellovibrionota bacterium]
MIKVIFENTFAIAVIKPAGYLSVPSRLGSHEKRPILGLELRDQIKGEIFPIHRLDFEVSGLMLFEKDKNFHREANGCFEKAQVHLTYQAITETLPTAERLDLTQELRWECFLVRGKKRAFEAPYGQKSITLAQTIEAPIWKELSPSPELTTRLDWRLSPLTGRAHQLRYELSKRGYPILGDELYGSTQKLINKKSKVLEDTIALKAIEINFKNCPRREQYKIPDIISIA